MVVMVVGGGGDGGEWRWRDPVVVVVVVPEAVPSEKASCEVVTQKCPVQLIQKSVSPVEPS